MLKVRSDPCWKSTIFSPQLLSPYLDKSHRLHNKTEGQRQKLQPWVTSEILAMADSVWAAFSTAVHMTLQSSRIEQCLLKLADEFHTLVYCQSVSAWFAVEAFTFWVIVL